MHELLEPQLSQLKIKPNDILRTELLVEEIFLRMTKYGDAAQVNVQVVKKIFGKLQIKMTAKGVSYNPLVEVADLNEDDEDYYAVMILKANAPRLNWLRRQNTNIVTIDVRGETNNQLRVTIAGIFFGIVCGFVMKEFFSPESIAFAKETFIVPISTMFQHALSMVIAPVIFFSIISGIIGMGKGAGVNKFGAKLIGMYLCTSAVASIAGLLIAQIIFSGYVPQIASIPAAEVSDYEFSLIQFIVDIIPANLVAPVAEGKMIQIIFLALLLGSCLNALGEKVSLLQEFMRNCNEFFMKVVGVIILFVPLIAFLAMITLVVDMGVDVVLTMGKLIIGELLGCGALLGVYMMIIFFVGKISPIPYLKKIPSVWPVPFATSSSAVAMPVTMNFCTKRLGISPKVTSFAIPIGTTINMDGACIYLPLAVIMFLKIYGVDIDWNAMLIILAMTVSISVGAPAVPNAAVICILTIASTFGVPNDIVGLLFCLSAVCERIVTCFNVTGDTAVCLTLGRTENLVDEKIYFGS